MFNLGSMGILLAQIVSRYPVNHMGFEPRCFWIFALLSFGTLCGTGFKKQTWTRVNICTLIALCVFLTVIDVFNMFVQYDIWAMRGLPDWGELKF